MCNHVIEKEFIGRLVFTHRVGETIYFYDLITQGLYKFILGIGEVNMTISPADIYRNMNDTVRGILKRKNEIILIPMSIDSEWIFYDTKKKGVRCDFPINSRINISGAVTAGSNLFLIPINVDSPVIMMSLDTMKVVKKYEDWHKNIEGKMDYATIWGAYSYGDSVIFPVVFTNSVVCVDKENIKVLEVKIPNTILSVSTWKDRIWILPTAGDSIYITDMEGEIVERVNLSRIETGVSVDKFVRIVATGEAVFLFPIQGEDICVYLSKKNQIVRIRTGASLLYGRLFEENRIPYWDFVIENETLHMLPCDCRYKTINISSLENEEYSLYYGKNIDHEKYWRTVKYDWKDCVFEKERNNLEDFFQYVRYFDNDRLVKENKKFGKEIWEKIVDSRQ